MPSKQFKEDSAILHAHRQTWEPETKAEGEAFLAKYTPKQIEDALHRVEHHKAKRGPKKGSKKAPKKGGKKTRRHKLF